MNSKKYERTNLETALKGINIIPNAVFTINKGINPKDYSLWITINAHNYIVCSQPYLVMLGTLLALGTLSRINKQHIKG